jgi:hypothetical protein
MIVSAGGVVPNNFNAGYGSTVVLREDGRLGENFEANWSNVIIEGGVVANYFDAIGGSVTITGGHIGNSFQAMANAAVEISGGHIEAIQVS